MAYSVDTNTTNTPFNQLRESLDKAERLVVQVDGKTIVEFLTLLDSIEKQFEALEEGGNDVRSEQSRWDSLLSRINSKPNPIVHAANVAGGMDKLRAANPPAESFWWHLDQEVAKRRFRSIRRAVTTLVVIVGVAVGGYYAINYFFPPDPEAVAMVETNNSLDHFIEAQNWQGALALVKSVRAQLPHNAELMVWEAVLNERLGNQDAANAAAAEAQKALAATPSLYWVTLGNTRLRVNDLKGAQAAGEQGLKIDPNEPQLYFLLGGVAENAGDNAAAINYFQKTSELAEGDNPQLAVIARVRMGQLLQSPGSLSSPAATPITTPTAMP
jgi:hypothetical protein